MTLPVPPPESLDSLERLGRIVNVVGVPLVMVLFAGVYFGWVPSPLTTAAEKASEMGRENNLLLRKHVDEMTDLIQIRKEELEQLRRTMDRTTEVLKLVDCGQIPDPVLRNRCLSR